jgi:hypothetical protein
LGLIDEIKAGVDGGAVPQDAVVGEASKSAGRGQGRARPYFGDSLTRLIGTVGVVGVMDHEKWRRIVETARHPGNVGVDERDAEAAVEAVLQTGTDTRSEAVSIREDI